MVDGGSTDRSFFERFVEGVLQREGAATNDPDDPGKETTFGISRRHHPNIPWPPTREQAIAIYRAEYWDPIRGDQLPPPLALVVFDAAVVPGVSWATRALQEVLRVTVDGAIGPKTIEAARRTGGEAVLRFTDARSQEFIRRAAKMTKGEKFLKGWRWRTLRVFREAVRLEMGVSERPAV